MTMELAGTSSSWQWMRYLSFSWQVNLTWRPSTYRTRQLENAEKIRKKPGFGSNRPWPGAASSATEKPKAVGSALLTPIQGNVAVNLARAPSYN
jgi:hypothetical protein